MLLIGLYLLQAVVNVPAYSPPESASPPPGTARLSLVVATTVSETDPQKLCARPDCTSLFLGRYRDAVVMAGPVLAREFTARVEMGSPWDQPYRLALIVEHRDGREPRVQAMAGFSQMTGEACFESTDIKRLGWMPTASGVVTRNGTICIRK